MSSLNVCVDRREKEQAELKTFLVYSVVASAAFHLVLAFGIDFFWPKKSASAEKPIEFILVDAPKTEIKQPEEKVQAKLPTPEPRVTPKTVVTPKPIEPLKPNIVTPPPTVVTPPPTVVTPPPTVVTPPPTVVTPKAVEKPPEVVKPIAPPPEPIAPQPQIVPTQPEPLVNTPLEQPTISSQPLPPPQVPERSRQPLSEPTPQTPLQNIPVPTAPISPPTRSFRNNVATSNPATPINPEPTEATPPQTPGSVETNQKPPERSTPTINDRPLQASASSNREFRDNFSNPNSLPTPNESNPANDTTPVTPGIPGGVAANQEPVSKPTVNSQPLQASASTGNREFRDNFSSSNNFLTGSSPTDDVVPSAPSTPQVPGGVAANRPAPSRPSVNSQPLQASGGGSNREFRDNFSSFSSSNSSSTGSIPTDDGIPSTPQVSGAGGVVANRKPPSRPAVNSQPLQASGTGGNREFRDNFSGSSSSSGSSGSSSSDLGSDFSPSVPSASTGGVTNRNVPPPRPNNQARRSGSRNGSRGGSGGVRCVSGCQPKAPASLDGLDIEGRPVVRLTIEPDGTPSAPEIIESSGNKLIDDAALEVALQMRFSPPEGGRTSIPVPINFGIEGSDFTREARRRRQENERRRRQRESLREQEQQSQETNLNSPPVQ